MFTLLIEVRKMLNSSKFIARGITVACFFACSSLHALSLGDFTVSSYLDEQLKAEIPVQANMGENLGSLNVEIASEADFNQAGINRVKSLDNFEFKVSTQSSDSGTISISSRNPINDPYVHVLLKLTWNGGQLLREFTALIDPPLYSSSQAAAIETYAADDYSNDQDDFDSETTTQQNYSTNANSYQGGNLDSIRVNSGASLGTIAEQIQFKYTDLSVYQIMQALYRDNPEAFISNNMNGLINGSVLKVADAEDIRQFSKKEGINIFYSQLASWNSLNGVSNSSYSSDNSDYQSGAQSVEPSYEDTAEANIDNSFETTSETSSSPEFQIGASSSVNTDGATNGVASEGVNNRNSDLEASYESAKLENEELKNAIAMLEAQLADSGKLIELNNQELANIQSQAANDDLMASVEEPVIEEPVIDSSAEESFEELESSATEFSTNEQNNEELSSNLDIAAPVADEAPISETPVVEEQITNTPVTVVKESKPEPTLVENLLSYVSSYWQYVAGALALILGGLWFVGRKSDEDDLNSFDDGFTLDVDEDKTVSIELSETEVDTSDATVTLESQNMTSSIDMDALREATQSVTDFSEDDEASTTEATKESSFLTVYNDGDIAANADEIDPINEADVYIAYGREDQGEEVLLEGVGNFPERVDIKAALLGLYLKTKQRGKFDTLYNELYTSDIDKSTDEWKAIDSLRYDMNLAVPGDSDAEATTNTVSETIATVSKETNELSVTDEDSKLDFDITVNSIVHELSEIDVHHEELSIDVSEIDFNNDDIAEIDDESISQLNAEIISEEAPSAVEDLLSSIDSDTDETEIDFSAEVLTEEYTVDVDVDNSQTASDTIDISMEIDASEEDSMMSISLEDTADADVPDSVGEIEFEEDHSNSEELLLDLSEVDMDLSELSMDESDEELNEIDLNLGDAESDLPDGTSDPRTQLDLAKVFIELDDVSGAVNILKGLINDDVVGEEATILLAEHT